MVIIQALVLCFENKIVYCAGAAEAGARDGAAPDGGRGHRGRKDRHPGRHQPDLPDRFHRTGTLTLKTFI